MKLSRTLLLTAIILASWPVTPRAQGGITLTSLFSFGFNYTNSDGTRPSAVLVQGKDGSFYGTTPSGGTNGQGTAFKITTNGAYTALISFEGAQGANPTAGLVLGADGNFYGTTRAGGTYDLGTVFRLSPSGTLTTLFAFNGPNGANPAGRLVQGTNGLLYGTTEYGGTNDLEFGGDGTIFKITTNGVLTRIYSFANGDDGGNPTTGLVQGKDGNFYGTTPYGGTDGFGSVFKVTNTGVLTTLYSFTGDADGGTPNGGVVQGKDGNFYGTTAYGGAYDVDLGGDGTVFKLTAGGVLTTLLSFNITNGSDPEAGLVQGADSILYGTTSSGGAKGYGTVFKITTNGLFTSLASFTGANGAQPQAGLAQGADGGLYGTTTVNGVLNDLGGSGTVFRIATNGILSSLYVFGDNNPNGARPVARLVRGADGNFYGTTAHGGTNHGSFGTVFKLAANGAQTVLASFNGTNGAYPQAGLVAGSDGSLYGTAAYGGVNSLTNGGDGTVFKITTNGLLSTLVSFGGTNGANPAAELALGLDGSFYGTTQNGGTNHVANGGDGTVFKITTNGILTRLFSFNRTNGTQPVAGLTLGPDGNFYGTTAYGGTNDVAAGGNGTVFRVTTGGTLTRLHSFNGFNGAYPLAGLVLGTNGSLYGTTFRGGADSAGTIFKITTNGVRTTLHAFTGGDDGAGPAAALLLGTDGNFYGTTASGGVAYSGTAFQITHAGLFTVLYSFMGESDGAQPVAGLAEGAAGRFYGTTELGGTNNAGTCFQLFVSAFPSITTQPADLASFAGARAIFSVSALGAAPLNYRWQRTSTNLTDHGNISGSATSTLTLSNITLADAAGYSVVISNASGAVTSTLATLTVLSPFPPTVVTEAAMPVGFNSATLNAWVNPNGAATTAWFKWGLTTNYGNVSALANVGSGGSTKPVSVNVTGLLPLTVYHFTALAGSALGTNTGLNMSFLTPGVRSNVTFTALVSFGSTNGAAPQAGLWQGADGKLYGTTYDGGADGLGTVFRMTTNGLLTTLLSFNGTNGSHPDAGLVQAANGVMYGTTYDGGTNDLASGGYGTVFKITTNGVFTSLVSFNSTNGANPAAGLTQGLDGSFYGTTEYGGTNDVESGGDGTIFKVTTNGVLTHLVSFDGANGSYPDAGLTLAANGIFYGTTSGGGADDSGTVFKVTTNGVLTTLYSFTGGEDGADPEAGLAQDADGNLYGTTFIGGTDGFGTVFRITTNGALTTLYSFTGGIDGASPAAGLLLGANGNFYGTTSSGGAGDYGTVFVMSPGGTLTTLVLFDYDSYGANPLAGLLEGADGSLYGTVGSGGAYLNGTLFRLSLPPTPPVFRTLTQTGSTLTLAWSAVSGQTYQLQYHTNLDATNWITLASLTATNTTATASDTMNASEQRYYRVVWLR